MIAGSERSGETATAADAFLSGRDGVTDHHIARRTAIVVAGLSVTAVVGLSRVYLGVHYLSDVTSGWAVAAFWFAFFGAIALVTTRLRKT